MRVVATLALGLRPRQGGCKVAGQEGGWESHHMLSRVQRVWENEPSHSQMNSHCGSWSPKWISKILERNFRGQRPLVWKVFYIIRNLLKPRYVKWAYMTHLDIWNTSYGQKKGQECRNPTLAKCGAEAQHLEKVRIWSPLGLPNVHNSTTRPKTPRIEVFLVSLEKSWSVDIENGLALVIWTSVAQVMGKRRAGSQIGNLTPDH
jgi:hypothetical protein